MVQVDVSRAIMVPIGQRRPRMKPLPRLRYDGAIDADGHVLEPPDLWEQYLEPKYRDVAIRLKKDDQGLEYVEIGGRASRVLPSPERPVFIEESRPAAPGFIRRS